MFNKPTQNTCMQTEKGAGKKASTHWDIKNDTWNQISDVRPVDLE